MMLDTGCWILNPPNTDYRLLIYLNKKPGVNNTGFLHLKKKITCRPGEE
jgi:hypothetical protein